MVSLRGGRAADAAARAASTASASASASTSPALAARAALQSEAYRAAHVICTRACTHSCRGHRVSIMAAYEEIIHTTIKHISEVSMPGHCTFKVDLLHIVCPRSERGVLGVCRATSVYAAMEPSGAHVHRSIIEFKMHWIFECVTSAHPSQDAPFPLLPYIGVEISCCAWLSRQCSTAK